MLPRKTTRLAVSGLLFLTLASTTLIGATSDQRRDNYASAARVRLLDEVRHQLVMLPYYGVFDNLAFQIQGVDTVVLSGQVTRPTLKSDAEHAVGRLEGVARVINNIEVLPLSPNDDRIRIAEYRAIYSHPGLDRYGFMAVPSIHIIVRNGHVTLEGVVARQADKDVANVVANGVPGVFSVTNNLRLESRTS